MTCRERISLVGSIAFAFVVTTACGGKSASDNGGNTTGAGAPGAGAPGAGASSSGGASSAGANSVGGAAHAGSGGTTGQAGSGTELVVPRMPEMEPVMVDNATGTRLIELLVGPPTFLVFEDGTVATFWHETDDQGNIVQTTAPIKIHKLDNPTQIDFGVALHHDGTVDWWQYGATYVDAMTMLITGVDHAVFVSNGCALIGDGSVRCWNGPPTWFSDAKPPEGPAGKVNPMSAPALELESNYNSRCTLLRDAKGAVTLFEPARLANGDMIASAVHALTLASPAIRLFEGCALERDGGARCVWGGTVDGSTQDVGCVDAGEYDLTTPNGERLAYASLSADFNASALGVSGTVYATIKRPDPKLNRVDLEPLPGTGAAVFVRSGKYISCAVTPPSVVCWPHEGTNKFVPGKLNLMTMY